MSKIPILYDTESNVNIVLKPKEAEAFIEMTDQGVVINGDLSFTINTKDGFSYRISIDDYINFIIIHKKSPKECTKAELQKLTFQDRI